MTSLSIELIVFFTLIFPNKDCFSISIIKSNICEGNILCGGNITWVTVKIVKQVVSVDIISAQHNLYISTEFKPQL